MACLRSAAAELLSLRPASPERHEPVDERPKYDGAANYRRGKEGRLAADDGEDPQHRYRGRVGDEDDVSREAPSEWEEQERPTESESQGDRQSATGEDLAHQRRVAAIARELGSAPVGATGRL